VYLLLSEKPPSHVDRDFSQRCSDVETQCYADAHNDRIKRRFLPLTQCSILMQPNREIVQTAQGRCPSPSQEPKHQEPSGGLPFGSQMAEMHIVVWGGCGVSVPNTVVRPFLLRNQALVDSPRFFACKWLGLESVRSSSMRQMSVRRGLPRRRIAPENRLSGLIAGAKAEIESVRRPIVHFLAVRGLHGAGLKSTHFKWRVGS